MQLSSALLVTALSCVVGSATAQSWDCSGISNSDKKTSCKVFSECLDATGFASWNSTVKESLCGKASPGGNVCGDKGKSCDGEGVKIAAKCNGSNKLEKIFIQGAALNDYIDFDGTAFEACLATIASDAPKFIVFNMEDATADETPFESVCKTGCTSDSGDDICKFSLDVLTTAESEYGINTTDFMDSGMDFFNTGFDTCGDVVLTSKPTVSPTAMPTTASPTTAVTGAPTSSSGTSAPTLDPADNEGRGNTTETDSPTAQPTSTPTDAPSSGTAVSSSLLLVATAVVASLGL